MNRSIVCRRSPICYCFNYSAALDFSKCDDEHPLTFHVRDTVAMAMCSDPPRTRSGRLLSLNDPTGSTTSLLVPSMNTKGKKNPSRKKSKSGTGSNEMSTPLLVSPMKAMGNRKRLKSGTASDRKFRYASNNGRSTRITIQTRHSFPSFSMTVIVFGVFGVFGFVAVLLTSLYHLRCSMWDTNICSLSCEGFFEFH